MADLLRAIGTLLSNVAAMPWPIVVLVAVVVLCPSIIGAVAAVPLKRRDAAPEGGGAPAGDPALVRRQLLDEGGWTGRLVGGNVFGLGAMPDADVAAALASA